jgi:DNA-binding MarR family transcriptional regulator
MSEPKWLDPQEANTWEALIWMMRAVDQALDDQLQRDSQISHASYGILVALSRVEGGSVRMGTLAQAMGWSQSRLSHAVARMEKADWVRRVPCPTDKRSNLAQLTEAGRQKLVDAAPGHVAAVRHLVIDALEPEQLQTLAQIGETVVGQAMAILGDTLPFSAIPRLNDSRRGGTPAP